MSGSETKAPASPPPLKRARRHISPEPTSDGMSRPMSSTNLPPLSLSILGVEPLDEFIREIADFVHHMIMTRPNAGPDAKVEVEAKVGVLRDRAGQRIFIPVLVETILTPNEMELRFESNMSANQHKHFNTLLNELMRISMQPGHPSTPLKYTHLKVVDSFYVSDRDREKIRITRDEVTGQVVECVQKVRLGDLNIFSPKRTADWRVSVNLEIPVPVPTGVATHTRKKDRICYAHEEFNIDLTQVKSSSAPNAPPDILHELELEIARPGLLLSAATKRGDPNLPEHDRSAFDELIRAFVNNARILVKNANDGWQSS